MVVVPFEITNVTDLHLSLFPFALVLKQHIHKRCKQYFMVEDALNHDRNKPNAKC